MTANAWGDTEEAALPPLPEDGPELWGDEAVEERPASNVQRPTSNELPLEWVKGFEGWNPKAYSDYKQTSIGYGTRGKPGEVIDREEGERRLRAELEHHARRVDANARARGYELKPHERDALISFDFNTGAADSALMAGGDSRDMRRVAAKMAEYHKVTQGGKKVPNNGLIQRRQKEVVRLLGEDSPMFWGDEPADDGDPNAWGDTPDTGMGRIESAKETARRSFGETVGGAMQGAATLAGKLIDPGEDTAEGNREREAATLAQHDRLYKRWQTMPEGAEKEALWKEVVWTRNRATEFLGRAQQLESLDENLGTPARQLRTGAIESTNPNPAYAQEFWAGAVPQALGNVAAVVPTAMVPGVGPVAAGAGMGAFTFQSQLEQNLANGMDPQTAEEKALLTAGVTGAMEPVGGLLIGRAVRNMAGGRPILRSLATAAGGEGVTEAMQSLAEQGINKGWGNIDYGQALKEGAAGAVAGGAVATTGVPLGLAARHFRDQAIGEVMQSGLPDEQKFDVVRGIFEQNGFTPKAAEAAATDVVLRAQGAPGEAPEGATVTDEGFVLPAEAGIQPAAGSVQTGGSPIEGFTATPAPPVMAPQAAAPVPAPAPPPIVNPDEAFARATGFPRGLLDYVTSEEAGALMALPEARRADGVIALMLRARSRKPASVQPSAAEELAGATGVPRSEIEAMTPEQFEARFNAPLSAETPAGGPAPVSTAEPQGVPPARAPVPTAQAVANPDGIPDVAAPEQTADVLSAQARDEALANINAHLAGGTDVAEAAAFAAAEAEYRAEMLAELDAANEATGTPLDKAVRRAGGLPSPESPAGAPYRAELAQLRETFLGANKDRTGRGRKSEASLLAELFSAEADADALIQDLRGEGFDVQSVADVAAMLTDGYARGRQPVGTRENLDQAREDIPFSLQALVTDGQVRQAQADAAKLTKKLGGRPVNIVRDAAALPSPVARRAARNGTLVEGYVNPATGEVVLNLDAIARVARQRKVDFHTRLRQVLLHEAIGHRGVDALFAAEPKAWDEFTARMWTRLKDSVFADKDAARLGYRTLAELSALYHAPKQGRNYDPATPEGRRNLIGEHVARIAEAGVRPAWWQALITAIKAALRKLGFGKWLTSATEDEIAGLLARAKRAAGSGGGGRTAFSFTPASTTVAATVRAQGRSQPVNITAIRAMLGYEPGQGGGGWNAARNMSNNAVAALADGKIMERDLPGWIAETLGIPARAITKAAVRRANYNAQNIFPEYHHVGKLEEDFYAPDDLLAQPKFWTGLARELKSPAHKKLAQRQALEALQAVREGLIASGALGTWSSAAETQNADPAGWAMLSGVTQAQIKAGTLSYREGVLADYERMVREHKATVYREENLKRGLLKQQTRNERELGAAKRAHPAQPFLSEKATAAPIAESGGAGLKMSEPGAPTRAEDARIAGRATEATSLPVQGQPNSAVPGNVNPQFSLAPNPDDRAIERALNADPATLKEHGLTKRARGLTHDKTDAIATMAQGLYATYSDAQAIADATRWLAQRTEAEAIATLKTLEQGQGDKLTFTAAQLMVERLHARGESREAGVIANRMATIATHFGQAIQSLHMMLRLGDEAAVLSFAETELGRAALATMRTPEGQAAVTELDKVRGVMERAAAANADARIAEHLAALLEAAETENAELTRDVALLVDAMKGLGDNANAAEVRRLQERVDALILKLRLQAQASQHLFGKTYAEMQRAIELLLKTRKELEALRGRGAARLLTQALDIIKNSHGLTEERQTDLTTKLRATLMHDDGTAVQVDRVAGILIAAGMKPVRARALAVKLVTGFRKRQAAVRESIIRQLASKAAALSAKVPAGMVNKWLEMNKRGLLDDSKLFAGIAAKWGFPTFTPADAARTKDFVRRYNAATDAEVKMTLAVEWLDWLHGKAAPAGILDKTAALYRLVKLLGFKTLERIFMSNTVAATMQTLAVDVPRYALGNLGVVVGRKYKPLETALGATVAGIRDAARIFRAGRVHGLAEGRNGVMAGFHVLITAARAHTAGIRDADGLKDQMRTIFTSRAGRMFTNFMHLALSVPDYPRFAGEVRQSLARQMAREGNPVPTAEQYKRATLVAQRSIWLNNEKAAKAANAIVKALNLVSTLGMTDKFGAGTVLIPFARVPANLAVEGLRWTPLGFIQAIYEGVNEHRNQLAGDQRQAVNTLLKAAAGTAGLIALGAYLFKLGIISAGDDDDREVNELRRSAGWQRFAINESELSRRMETGDWFSPSPGWQDGDVMHGYSWLQPIAFPLVVGAESERARQKGENPGAWSPLTRTASSVAKAASDQPMLMGLAKFSEDIAAATREDNLAPLAATGVRAFDFVPQFVRDVRYARQPAMSETRHANVIIAELNKIVGNVAPEALPQRFDVLGRAAMRYDVARQSWLAQIFNPFSTTIINQTPEGAEALRLFNATDNKGVIFDRVKARIEINPDFRPDRVSPPVKIELNTAQIAAYQEMTGRLAVLMTSQRMAQPGYGAITDEARAAWFAGDVSAAGTAAKMALFGHMPAEITIAPKTGAASRNFDARAQAAYLIGKGAGLIPQAHTPGDAPLLGR